MGKKQLALRNISLITHHAFWAEPLGCGTLMRGRYRLLKNCTKSINVLYLTTTDRTCPLPGMTIRVNQRLTNSDLKSIKDYVRENRIDLCYFSYNQLGFLCDLLDCETAVEIHDVIHLRQKQFEDYGYRAPYIKSKQQELEELRRYSYVISINREETTYLKKSGLENTHYLPPSLSFKPTLPPSQEDHLGFIGSQAKPNIDGLSNFLAKQPKLPNHLVLAGPITTCDLLKQYQSNSITSLGVIGSPSEFYRKIGLAISPIRFGAGLKIKVLESLAHGRPVLATKHSVEGFPDGIEDVVTVEDDVEKWTGDLIKRALVTPHDRIKQFFEQSFSPNVVQLRLISILG